MYDDEIRTSKYPLYIIRMGFDFDLETREPFNSVINGSELREWSGEVPSGISIGWMGDKSKYDEYHQCMILNSTDTSPVELPDKIKFRLPVPLEVKYDDIKGISDWQQRMMDIIKGTLTFQKKDIRILSRIHYMWIVVGREDWNGDTCTLKVLYPADVS